MTGSDQSVHVATSVYTLLATSVYAVYTLLATSVYTVYTLLATSV